MFATKKLEEYYTVEEVKQKRTCILIVSLICNFGKISDIEEVTLNQLLHMHV